MKVHYKGLIENRFEDAPFVGTLWIAPDCKFRCKGCFNQHLLDTPTLYEEGSDIIDKIKADPFSEGIIFAGLDPITYPDELEYLVSLSLDAGLKIIIYTGLSDKESLLKLAPTLAEYQGKGIYVKYGSYEEKYKVDNYLSEGVILATSNQYIEML